MDAARQLADVGDGRRCLGGRGIELGEGPGVGIRPESAPEHLERQLQRDQPLLRAVMEVSFDPPALVVLRFDDPRPRCAHGFQLRTDLCLEAFVLGGEANGRGGRRDQARIIAK